MSSLAKPFLKCTAVATNPRVNADKLIAYNKQNVSAYANAPADYQIIFTMDKDALSPTTIVWSFPVQADRDTSFAAIDTALIVAV